MHLMTFDTPSDERRIVVVTTALAYSCAHHTADARDSEEQRADDQIHTLDVSRSSKFCGVSVPAGRVQGAAVLPAVQNVIRRHPAVSQVETGAHLGVP